MKAKELTPGQIVYYAHPYEFEYGVTTWSPEVLKVESFGEDCFGKEVVNFTDGIRFYLKQGLNTELWSLFKTQAEMLSYVQKRLEFQKAEIERGPTTNMYDIMEIYKDWKYGEITSEQAEGFIKKNIKDPELFLKLECLSGAEVMRLVESHYALNTLSF